MDEKVRTITAADQTVASRAWSGGNNIGRATERAQIKASIEDLIEAATMQGMFTTNGEYVTQRWVPADSLRAIFNTA